MSHSSSTSSDVGVRRYFEAACVKRPYGRRPAPQNDDGREIEIYCVYSNEVALIRSKVTVMKWPYYGVEWGLVPRYCPSTLTKCGAVLPSCNENTK